MPSAIRVLKTSKLLSASATFYERVEAYNITWIPTTSANAWLSMNTTRTVNVVFANAGNQLGIMLYVRNCTTGTLTITLREGTTVRTTNTFDFAASPLSSAIGKAGWHYFPLTTYAVTGAAATWNYQFSCTSATPQALVTTTSGTDMLYMCCLDADSGKVASGDVLVLADSVTLTVDESVTHGALNTMCVLLSYGSVYQCTDASLAGAITITLQGRVFCSNNSKWSIGQSGLPIAIAHRVTMDTTALSDVYLFLCPTSSNIFTGDAGFEFYGAEDSYIGVRIASEAAQGQAHIITTVDMSAIWANGDPLCIIGKASPTATDTTNYTISSMSGTDITLNTNLDLKVLAGGAIVNGNRKNNLGIWILGLGTQSLFLTAGIIDYVQMAGVYIYKESVTGASGQSTYSTTRNLLMRNVLYDDGNITPLSVFVFVISIGSGGYNGTISGLYHFSTRTIYLLTGFLDIVCSNTTISNVFCKNFMGQLPSVGLTQAALIIGTSYYHPVGVSGNGNTVSGIVFSGGRYLSTNEYSGMLFVGASNVISDVFCYGITNYPLLVSMVNSTVTNLKVNGATKYNIVMSNSINLTLVTPTIGTTTPAVVSEFYALPSTLNTIFMSIPTISAFIVVLSTGFSAALIGSYLRIQNYNGTANDCRGVESYGYYVSTASGLADTTVHTAGGYGMRFESNSSIQQLTWTQTIPTGNIQNKTMMVGVWCKISNANYYSVTHQLPRLTINYDNGTTAYCQAQSSTDWQFLAIPFTPLTTYGQITATISTMTDQTGLNAYVYFDDYVVLYPAGVQLNLGSLDLWANGLPVMPTIATNLSALDVWSASTAVSYGSSTMGELAKTTEKKADDAASLTLVK